MVSEERVTMVGYQASLQPPQPFRFDTSDEWPKWRRRFEQFCVASGLSKEETSQYALVLFRGGS